ncbi:aminopeptidase [Pseudalkalibacillus hwajinpoensis]|uniref:Aminopeptidase n=1 Tax=Guptibacillus hwajinpoensis TaxID=208199 RepID=A0A4U1MJ26_9BACL|nr:aminopeptidase [Pseudalkalibacillus hwajinpoensis]TKD70482.1 aminopeptidase [Pseudalkalibacillus hwajinpoensis]
MATFHENLQKYADLAVRVGVNIQKGQTLVVNAPLTSAEFVRNIAESAYESGAKNVHVEWNDEDLTRIKFDKAPDEAFKEFPTWKAKGFEELAENGAAFLSITSSNPDLLKGVDPERISNASKTAGKAMEGYRNYIMSDHNSWSVVAVPSKAWAAKVFPDAPEEEQEAKLWDAIFQATRVSTGDPVQSWKEHSANLEQKVDYLNKKHYKKLHYKAPGTDLTIELPDAHLWVGGVSENVKGDYFVANMPTEEVFTIPHKNGINGVVASTKPLSYGGTVIEDFSLTFEDGRIIKAEAKHGNETLQHLIETDEGSHYLGEVALVPHDSPISNAEIIFFNTLFDENASNHLAIGNAYSFCLEGGKNMSKEELEAAGANESVTHVDFMIGSQEMDIDGIKEDGSSEPIFRDGNWSI